MYYPRQTSFLIIDCCACIMLLLVETSFVKSCFYFFILFMVLLIQSFKIIIGIWQPGFQITGYTFIQKKVLNITEGFVFRDNGNLSSNVQPGLEFLSAIEGDGVVYGFLDGGLLGQNVFMTPTKGVIRSLGIGKVVFEDMNLAKTTHQGGLVGGFDSNLVSIHQ